MASRGGVSELAHAVICRQPSLECGLFFYAYIVTEGWGTMHCCYCSEKGGNGRHSQLIQCVTSRFFLCASNAEKIFTQNNVLDKWRNYLNQR
jgi:hypothetical protein